MINWEQTLLEALQFAKGRDNDFVADSYAIITFNKGDIKDYKIEGKTAGLWSHACKHLDEIDKQFVDNIVQQVRNLMIEYIDQDNHPKSYEFNYYNGSKRVVKGDPETLAKRATRASIINFLDLVNDKVILQRKLAPIEAKCVKYLKALGRRYGQLLADTVHKAFDIDAVRGVDKKRLELNRQPIVGFEIDHSKINGKVMIYLDVKNELIIIKTDDEYNTMYRVNYQGSGRIAMYKAFDRKVMKSARFKDYQTGQAFNSLISK